MLRAHPLAALVTALALAGAAAPLATLRDAVTGAPAAGAALHLPAAYVAASPLARLLDGLALLAGPQHAAVGVTLLAGWTVWRVRRARAGARRASRLGGRRPTWGAAAWRETRAALGGLLALVATYAAAALAPRPMAALVATDPDHVRVDVHAHTAASHDVPAWFGPEERRAWSARGGYDVAFLSDHRSYDGAIAARRTNPARAGDGVSLLPALEARLLDIHILVLGLTPADTALLPDDHIERSFPRVLRGGVPGGVLPSGGRPVVLATIPDPVFEILQPWARDSFALRGVEVVDGAPRGLAQADRDGRALRARAAALGIVPVTASNHHGWGSAAVTWNLMRVPGWRALTPDALGARLVALLDTAGRAPGAVVPVVRARPRLADRDASPAARALAVAVTVPALAWQTARELTPAERGVWVAWAWGLVGVGALLRASGERRGAAALLEARRNGR